MWVLPVKLVPASHWNYAPLTETAIILSDVTETAVSLSDVTETAVSLSDVTETMDDSLKLWYQGTTDR